MPGSSAQGDKKEEESLGQIYRGNQLVARKQSTGIMFDQAMHGICTRSFVVYQQCCNTTGQSSMCPLPAVNTVSDTIWNHWTAINS